MLEVLMVVQNAMNTLGIEYAFGEYAPISDEDEEGEESKIVYPYFVGEYTESEPLTEDGLHSSTFMLTGFSRDSWLTLEEAKERIERHFNMSSGKTYITARGTGIAISYAGSMIVPTGDAELKKIQINLDIKEWKVN